MPPQYSWIRKLSIIKILPPNKSKYRSCVIPIKIATEVFNGIWQTNYKIPMEEQTGKNSQDNFEEEEQGVETCLSRYQDVL